MRAKNGSSEWRAEHVAQLSNTVATGKKAKRDSISANENISDYEERHGRDGKNDKNLVELGADLDQENDQVKVKLVQKAQLARRDSAGQLNYISTVQYL